MDVERPIILKPHEVRGILAGRQTQLRRVIKIQPPSGDYEFVQCLTDTGNRKHEGKLHWAKIDRSKGYPNVAQSDERYFHCPYGLTSDRLWVRESMIVDDYLDVWYSADMSCLSDKVLEKIGDWKYREPEYKGTIPSIHMPRLASRMTLEIVSVRVERLQAVSRKDAEAEGFPPIGWNAAGVPILWDNAADSTQAWTDPRLGFKRLWENINGTANWDVNPWVWVVEFNRLPSE